MIYKLLVLIICLLFPSCAGYQSLVRPTSYLISKKLIDKDSRNSTKILIVVNGLEVIANGLNKTLVLQDFINITAKAGKEPEWALLADYLYNNYKENIVANENHDEASRILLNIAQGMKESVAIAIPSK